MENKSSAIWPNLTGTPMKGTGQRREKNIINVDKQQIASGN